MGAWARLRCRIFDHEWSMVKDRCYRTPKERWPVRDVTMRCSRCGKTEEIRRMAFVDCAGAVEYFKGKRYPWKPPGIAEEVRDD